MVIEFLRQVSVLVIHADRCSDGLRRDITSMLERLLIDVSTPRISGVDYWVYAWTDGVSAEMSVLFFYTKSLVGSLIGGEISHPVLLLIVSSGKLGGGASHSTLQNLMQDVIAGAAVAYRVNCWGDFEIHVIEKAVPRSLVSYLESVVGAASWGSGLASRLKHLLKRLLDYVRYPLVAYRRLQLIQLLSKGLQDAGERLRLLSIGPSFIEGLTREMDRVLTTIFQIELNRLVILMTLYAALLTVFFTIVPDAINLNIVCLSNIRVSLLVLWLLTLASEGVSTLCSRIIHAVRGLRRAIDPPP